MIGIVDGSYMAYRAFCAGGQEALYRNSITILLDLLKDVSECWIAWDLSSGKGAELRRRDYPDYKSRREKKPADFWSALRVLQQCIRPLGIHQAWPEMGEADDAAKVLVDEFTAKGDSVLLWGRDKDWFQLLANPRVSMRLPPNKGLSGGEVISGRDVPKKLGVPAERVPAYLALAGDTSDDVPGMPRIGASRAASIIAVCPELVELVYAGQGDKAIAQVMSKDASLVRYVQTCVDNAELLKQMFALVHLREVPLIRRRGTFDRELAIGALQGLGCEFAIKQLEAIGDDDWDDWSTAEEEDDWSD